MIFLNIIRVHHPLRRQRTVEEATKRIDAALGRNQQNRTNTDAVNVETQQTHQQPTLPRTSQKKNAQMEMLPLFQEDSKPLGKHTAKTGSSNGTNKSENT